MLYNIYGQEISKVSYQETFNCFYKLDKIERDKINSKLQEIINETSLKDNNKILTSSFIPGKDWTNTVFQPIYEKASDCNEELAAKIFGLVLMQNFIDNDKEWVFMKPENTDIKGSYYFIKEY